MMPRSFPDASSAIFFQLLNNSRIRFLLLLLPPRSLPKEAIAACRKRFPGASFVELPIALDSVAHMIVEYGAGGFLTSAKAVPV
jgi:hypothetical protein